MAQTIAIVNRKGGSGKTTLAVNIAYALCTKKSNDPLTLLFIDATSRGDATRLLLGSEKKDINEHTGLASLLLRNLKYGYNPIGTGDVIGGIDSSVFHGVKRSKCPHLHLIPADLFTEAFEQEAAIFHDRLIQFPEHPVPIPIYELLSHLLYEIGYRYDFIIIDPPADHGFLDKNVNYIADYFISPITPDLTSINGIFDFFENLINEDRMLLQKKKTFLAIFSLYFNPHNRNDNATLIDISNKLYDFIAENTEASHLRGRPSIITGPGRAWQKRDKTGSVALYASRRSKDAIQFKNNVIDLFHSIMK